jgi:hypothetical protein
MHKALIDFPCSFNGIDIVHVNAGSVMDFGDLANGLVESGAIEPSEAEDDEEFDVVVQEGEPLILTDEERAALPPLDPKASDGPENRTLVEPKSKK